MAYICMKNVTLEFPILHSPHQSLKKVALTTLTGGKLMRDAHDYVIVRALQNVSLEIKAGERIALIGHNGAGKTTLLRTMASIYEPTNGKMKVEGKVSTLLDLNLGMDPDLTGEENLKLRFIYMGLTPNEIEEILPEVREFSELGPFLKMPLRTYSSGMQLRLAFSAVTSISTDILLMDEWMLAGDVAFLEKAHKRMQEFINKSAILVLATHDESVARQWCTRAILLKEGEVIADGEVDRVINIYHKIK